MANLPPEANLSPSPKPCSTVPFRRDPDFVDCDILDEVHLQCSQPASRVALVGLGGIGKSQLVIEYSYRVRERSPSTWVFWVHAGNATRFQQGFLGIAEVVKPIGWDQPQADILRLVRNWLCDESKGRWLIIVDNADDSAVFDAQSQTQDPLQETESLSAFLPQSMNGSILITSRSQDVAFALTGSIDSIIQIQPMESHHSLTLLRKKLKVGSDDAHEQELLANLEYMPLAITQTAAYIRLRGITVTKYLQALCKDDKDRARLLQRSENDLRRDGKASNSIIGTWHISFTHINQANPLAARLLALMSHFDRQSIPSYLLQSAYTDGRESDFDDDLYVLTRHYLVSKSLDGDSFTMHRLVQFSTRQWLELHGQHEQWREVYIDIMDKAFPPVGNTNWQLCSLLLPHAQIVLQYKTVRTESLAQVVSVVNKVAWHLEFQGHSRRAEILYRQGLDIRDKLLDKDGPSSMAIMNNLALTLSNQGKYEEAENLLRQILQQNDALGESTVVTARCTANLALVLLERTKYAEAEKLLRNAIQLEKEALGEEDPDVLQDTDNLVAVLSAQGKYEEAEALSRQIMKLNMDVLGEMHPRTLLSMNILGTVLVRADKCNEAEELLRHTTKLMKEVLSEDHPYLLTCTGNLGQVLQSQGKPKEAEALLRQTTKLRMDVLGEHHPKTMQSMIGLAEVLLFSEKYDEAEELLRPTMKLMRESLGSLHSLTLGTMKTLGILLLRTRRVAEAKTIFQEVSAGDQSTCGPEHPSTFVTTRFLAVIAYQEGNLELSTELFQKALAGLRRTLGPDHGATLICIEEYRACFPDSYELNDPGTELT